MHATQVEDSRSRRDQNLMAAESRGRVKSGQFLAPTSLRSGMTGKLGDLPAQLAVSLPGSIPGSCQAFSASP